MLVNGNSVLIIILNTFYVGKCNKLTSSFAMEALSDVSKNAVVSPLLVRFPLCKLTSKAEGTAKSQLLSILGIKSKEVQNCYTELKYTLDGMKRNMDFLSINKIIVNYTDDVKLQFITNSSNYGIRVDKVGFNYPSLAVAFINRLVDKETYKRVRDVLEPNDINNKTTMLIINAAYLKVTWESPFDIRSTKSMKFYHLDGKVSSVPMMMKFDSCLYLLDENINTQFITMKLASFGVTMTVIVPKTQKGLSALLRKLQQDPDYINGIQNRMKFETIKISMPRIKIKSRLDLNKYLQKIGASQLFNETYSGLNTILKENSTVKYIHLTKVKQSNFIDIDEMGIFRSLPRDFHYDEMNRPNSGGAVEAICDHPFYFTINIQTDTSNNARMYHLFQGVYYGPEE